MSLLTLFYLLAGLVLLVAGAEALVKGCTRLGARLRIAPAAVGLTLAAFGSSTPETAVAIQAVWRGSGDLALGTVLGSNIANILLLLGGCALVRPLAVSRRLLRLEVPLLIAVGVAVYVMAWDARLSRAEGVVLLLGLATYVALAFAAEASPAGTPRALAGRPRLISPALLALGCTALTGGSQLLFIGATQLAQALGLSELVVGLTLVALIGALPEAITALLATLRGERELAVSTLLGSCLFNLQLAGGSAAALAPDGLSVSPNALAFDFPVLLASSLACLPIFFSGRRINRWEGLLFLGYYLAYGLYLIMFATGLPALTLFRQAMGWFVLPLSGITLAVIFLRSLWRTRHSKEFPE